MAVSWPNVCITLMAVCVLLPSAIWECCFTHSAMFQWAGHLRHVRDAESVAMTGILVSDGFIMLLGFDLCLGVLIRGQEHTKANMSIAIGLYCLLCFAELCMNMTAFQELEMTSTFLYEMLSMLVVIGLLSGLAYKTSKLTSPFKNHSLYFNACAWVILLAIYTVWMKVDAASLAAAYGISFSTEVMEVVELLTAHNMANDMILILLQIIAIQCSNDALAQYGMMRSLMYFGFGNFAMACVTKNEWIQIGAPDQVVAGQTFNCFLWVAMYMITFFPVLKLDESIRSSIEKQVRMFDEAKDGSEALLAQSLP